MTRKRCSVTVAWWLQDFDRYFFALESTRFRGLQMPAYKLPSTFYMTTYRAQTAEGVV